MNQDTPVDPSTTPAPSAATGARPAAGAWLLAGLALLAAIAAGGGTYYLWRMQDDQRLALQTAQSELEQLQAQQREHGAGLDRAVAALRAQLKTQQDALDALNARKEQPQLRSSREWTLREVEYLLQIANQRVQLDHDVASAVAALVAANERLHELADPALLAVRRQLAVEINALRAVPLVDREGLVLALISDAERIDRLPLANAPRAGTNAAAAGATQTAARDWHVALDAAWEAIKRLVIVRRDNRPAQPLLAPEQEYFLRQNLHLQLEAARVALLRADAGSFTAGITSARDWIKRYFDTTDRSVSSLIEALDAMAKLDIAPPMPDISESLRLLRLHLGPEHVMEGALRIGPEGGRAS